MSNFLLTVQAPSDVPELKISRLSGREEIGRPFHYELELTSQTHTITAESILGKGLSVSLAPETDNGREFHGIVTSFQYLGSGPDHARYRAILRPWVWLLSQRATCRIFQKMTAPDIILQVFRDAGFSDFSNGLAESYRERDYCVQYRESDLDFVTRLMEEEGIYYIIQHAADKHTLKLLDQSAGHPAASQDSFPFVRSESVSFDEFFYEWRNAQQLLTTKYRLNDYNFLNPTGDLKTAGLKQRQHAHADFERYDYPGVYEEEEDGTQLVNVRVQQRQAEFDISEGVGQIACLTCGESFQLSEHSREDQNRKYIALRTQFLIDAGNQELSRHEGSPELRCEVLAYPESATYRLPDLTHRPRIQGPQTAVVVGPSDKEIYTDPHARVKLKFHWDLTPEKDENASCWVRVAQVWAGNKWGAMHIPRIGQEVVVEFLEGDPDRPLVTGRVYNAALMPPYALETNETQSGLKSRSTPDGDAETFNELRFEDKMGEEEIYLHAEKDFTRIVENNDVLKVGFDKQDKGDQTIEIFNNQTITIGHSDAETGHRTTTLVIGNEELTLNEGNRTVTLDKGNDTHHLKEGNREVKIDQGNDTLTIAQGDLTIKTTAGSIAIEAGTSIELKVGSNSIKIDQQGVTIAATKVAVNATGQLELDGTGQAKLTSSGVLTVQGSMVKIN